MLTADAVADLMLMIKMMMMLLLRGFVLVVLKVQQEKEEKMKQEKLNRWEMYETEKKRKERKRMRCKEGKTRKEERQKQARKERMMEQKDLASHMFIDPNTSMLTPAQLLPILDRPAVWLPFMRLWTLSKYRVLSTQTHNSHEPSRLHKHKHSAEVNTTKRRRGKEGRRGG